MVTTFDFTVSQLQPNPITDTAFNPHNNASNWTEKQLKPILQNTSKKALENKMKI